MDRTHIQIQLSTNSKPKNEMYNMIQYVLFEPLRIVGSGASKHMLNRSSIVHR